MQKQEFEKRTPFLDKTDHENYAYWKRFGASKIQTWTYWTEA